MKVAVTGWSGVFDLDISYKRGMRGDGYFQPDDPDELTIDNVEWMFCEYDSIFMPGGEIDSSLYAALESAAWEKVVPGDYDEGPDDYI